ncbi:MULTISPECIES: tyrosine-type recombinase/integrase [Bacillaceae]|uniref:Tyrosine-type recombinase/integrase n=1 Tax=Evansella alkalicola TaxID=745819 RepID=A0ABS6K233_9BACI|nr:MULTISPECIES: site-specific integrase [Bacillaceae]MBU9723642.1 tyrosine-type recombinase/integrase [Bacillus alkalicola]
MAKKVIIEKGNKKSYAVIFGEGIDPQTGMYRLNQKGFRTSEEADEFIEQLGSIKEEMRIDMVVDHKGEKSTKVPFSQYAKDWFYGEHAHMIATQTFKVRQALLEKHIVPYFGDMNLLDITEIEILELFNQKSREGYSEGTIGSIQNFLSTLFRSAVTEGLINKHPMRRIKKRHTSNRSPIILSESEVQKLLEVAHSEGEGMMYEFEISTGLRLGEILALSWSDIDFEHKMIIVNKIVDAGVGGKHNIVEMRSDYRKVMIPSHLIPKLQKHKEEQQLMKEVLGGQYHDELDLVFPKKGGGIQSPSTVRTRFNRLVDKANISKITFHDLRKTHASLLVKVGVPPYLVSKQLSYKSADTLYHFLPLQFSDSTKSIKLLRNNDKENDID